MSFIQRNNLVNESFAFDDDKSDQCHMSSLERGMRVRDEVQRNGRRGLGDGPGGWQADIYGEEGMWVGAAFEEFVQLDQEESDY
jgi:hypothetical protein